jgi:ethanolamine utilization protein EutM
MTQALGFLETRGLVAALEGCDAMLKAAQVSLVQQQVTSPAIVTICIRGETAAVQSAIEAGVIAAERVGRVLASHVIPRPGEGVDALVNDLSDDVWASQRSPAAKPPPERQIPDSLDALRALPVPRLRALARSLEDFPLGGRQISLAKRDELLKLLIRQLFS